MKTLISIDPGMSTGIIVGTYSDTEPFKVTHAFQIEGGVEGFLKEVRVSHGEDWYMLLYGVLYVGRESFEVYSERRAGGHADGDFCKDDDCPCFETERDMATVLCEKFNARGEGNGFSYRTSALEPLRIEGAILAMGIDPTWVQPAQQYFLGGSSKAEKLKARNAWFKEHKDLGYYITGKNVGCGDADDARSALAHCIAYLRRQRHKPTLELFRRGEDVRD